jgi:hypothetical protein
MNYDAMADRLIFWVSYHVLLVLITALVVKRYLCGC